METPPTNKTVSNKCAFTITETKHILSPCVTGDTLIATDKGSVFIRDLVGVPTRIYGEDGRLHSSTGAFSTGVQTIATLTTQNGHYIRATLKHKFLTTKGDKELRYLSLEDKLLTADGTTTHIESIRLSGSEEVFDLVALGTMYFIANGLTVCTCTS